MRLALTSHEHSSWSAAKNREVVAVQREVCDLHHAQTGVRPQRTPVADLDEKDGFLIWSSRHHFGIKRFDYALTARGRIDTDGPYT